MGILKLNKAERRLKLFLVLLTITIALTLAAFSSKSVDIDDVKKSNISIIIIEEKWFVYTKFQCKLNELSNAVNSEIDLVYGLLTKMGDYGCRILYSLHNFSGDECSSDNLTVTFGFLSNNISLVNMFHRSCKNYFLAHNFRIKLLGISDTSSSFNGKLLQHYDGKTKTEYAKTFVFPILCHVFNFDISRTLTGFILDSSKNYFLKLPGMVISYEGESIEKRKIAS